MNLWYKLITGTFLSIGSLFFSPLIAQEDIVPQFPEWMVTKRMEALNFQTPISLDYNEAVQAYIDVYTVKRRKHLTQIISRSKLYFPLFEEYLDKYNLPMELKYLAVIESALDPRAKSKSGAKGLWQFLYHSGKMFDLEVSTYIDQRSDPVLATEAACKYLQYLYHNLKDWQLALAAYNGGIGVVKNAIERSGGKKNYWELRPFLPEEVRGYVPAFIAANYVLNYYNSYDIANINPQYDFEKIDTVCITHSLSFDQIEQTIGISKDILGFLNPIFTKDYIPVNEQPVPIFLPREYIADFVKLEPVLYGTIRNKNNQELSKDSVKIVHTVQKGEYFHKIAITYLCTIDQIIKWNNLSSKDLHPGQKLIIYKPKEENPYFFIRNEVDFMTLY